MVLMRFADALTCLPVALGNQVHRSHWVAWGHVNKSFIRAGRQFLLLDNGVEVPVSRRFKKVVRERFG
jgi:DNA-binding LytR/AlgR family response regulator